MTKYRRFDTGEDDYYILPDGELISVKDYDGYLGDMYEDWREEDDPEDTEPETTEDGKDPADPEDAEAETAEDGAGADPEDTEPENSKVNGDPEAAEDGEASACGEDA